jgi:G6PDH family F420-dependent oxidoreductase
MRIGIGFSGEELGPKEIVRAAAVAEEAGFFGVCISDHFHPWLEAQGSSPFVWSVLGAISRATDRIRAGTAVTCPIMRIHPAIVAQAAATTQCMFDGRFWLGVGTGEALNEHIVGAKWPESRIRREMLEEAVAILRRLWSGEEVSHYGEHFTVENARLYTRPERDPEIYVSAFGSRSARLAARIGDGMVSTAPDDSMTRVFDEAGGFGPKIGFCKVAWAETREKAEDLAYERWPTSALPGELHQELPTPAHFQQAVSVLRREDIVARFACGPDPERHLAVIEKYADAGYDELYVTQIGPDQRGFLQFYEHEVLPYRRERPGLGSVESVDTGPRAEYEKPGSVRAS